MTLLWPGAAATAAAANLFATVTATGGLISGSRALSVSQLGPGQYEVSFDTDVSQCAYVATTGKLARPSSPSVHRRRASLP